MADIQRLRRYLAVRNEDAARRAIRTIRAGVATIGRRPELGRMEQELGPGFREWVVDFGNSGYVVLYHFDGTVVSILAVRHQREAGY